jgi:hypothetical protein
MTFENPRDEFAVRYYLWAQEEFRLEIEHDFPLLRRIPAIPAKTCLKLMSQMSLSEKQFFAQTMVRRFHAGSRLLGEAQTSLSLGESPEEQELISLYRVSLRDVGLEVMLTQERKDAPPNVSRRKRKARLREMLGPILGEEESALKEAPVWYYSSEILGFNVRTCLDVVGGHRSISYNHGIYIQSHEIFFGDISILSWLGMTSGTAFNPISEVELEPTVQVLADVCQRFLDVAPKLLKGIKAEGKTVSRA